MKDKFVNMHKRLAMGDSVKGYAKGGSIGRDVPSLVPVPTGRAVNPIRAAKATNGVPGFKRGGEERTPRSGSGDKDEDDGYKKGGSAHGPSCNCAMCKGGRMKKGGRAK
jgi:hypothetical protein